MTQNTEQPIPQGKYLPAIRHNDLIYTSGMTPRKAGKLIFSGQISANDPIEIHKEAVSLACINALVAAQACLSKDEKISTIIQLNVFLNTETAFTAHSAIANFASYVLIENLGANCIGSRTAIGVNSLPSNATVEISLIARVVKD